MPKPNVGKRDFLVSIKPNYVKEIIEGTKTVELRRRFVADVSGTSVMLIYSTSPTRAVVGYARIKAVMRMRVSEIWRQFGAAARILRAEFNEYFRGVEEGFAILLGKVTTFDEPIPAATLRSRFGFVAPQSFMYLRDEYYSLLNGRRKNTNRH